MGQKIPHVSILDRILRQTIIFEINTLKFVKIKKNHVKAKVNYVWDQKAYYFCHI